MTIKPEPEDKGRERRDKDEKDPKRDRDRRERSYSRERRESGGSMDCYFVEGFLLSLCFLGRRRADHWEPEDPRRGGDVGISVWCSVAFIHTSVLSSVARDVAEVALAAGHALVVGLHPPGQTGGIVVRGPVLALAPVHGIGIARMNHLPGHWVDP